MHLANGLPGLTLVGLPANTVKEMHEQVRRVLINVGFDSTNTRGITLNLAPADPPKKGCRFGIFACPSGTGKTMLASRLLGILPMISEEDALKVATVRSCAD